ncbi:pseudouridine-5'-phosphate glycosidase [Methylobacterium nodulans]|uniref:Pseudouridine-5'-phosphate glycosidase n=1 Tax=Methylobacterium nodulans (strain LMG 21967 / CNCM I-2342 / ORS 2060) TaxID=460265 RepID=PSUG_METNO|nr:pseudouridine-5'-phosphate glycosidase [Methylobacterium nodulans]B8II14.1 RecName: Full=Pseudouridine-5'-phosphate glycosidase; Short=PsiMP glycosidase [Methylobacterium nodulans ORS 2060]ACL56052.1 Indigoidine synthase A family protein [Methylobacterium nodulans ORS 2060]
MPHPLLDFAPEVRSALDAGAPVVALESTIVTHGMPHPQNVETARAVAAVVRANGAVPAIVAVVAGRIRIGLPEEILDWLGTAKEVLKLSRADLPHAVAAGLHGSTTVAATMICAHRAGIRVFATGGIGGVHRGVEETLDISADLDELARTPVAVVCAGAKAILDLPRTLEYLETRGVPVVGYRTDRFPAFWSRDSGLPAPLRLDTPEAIAALMRTKEALDLGGGILVANPVPEADEIPAREIAALIATAVAQARAAGIAGKAVTPFLLSRLLDLTGGRSLSTNIALVKNNAALAAQLAVALRGARSSGPQAGAGAPGAEPGPARRTSPARAPSGEGW